MFNYERDASLERHKKSVKEHVKTCETCQSCKKPIQNRGKLTMKNNMQTMRPWNRVCADVIRPREMSINETIKGKRGQNEKIRTKIVTVCALTIAGESSSSPEIVRIGDETIYETQRAFEK